MNTELELEITEEQSLFGSHVSSLRRNGYCIFDLHATEVLGKIIAIVEKSIGLKIPDFHHKDHTIENQVELILRITNEVAGSDLVSKLIFRESNFLKSLLGPDIDIQSTPHLRMSRPKSESEMIGWHRDSFYGNSPLEMNIWFPLAELGEGAGLCVLEGTHIIPSKNTRAVEETDNFKKTITKGSAANKIGFQYSPKTDDTIADMKKENICVLRPRLGQAILFFGCMAHKAQNASDISRASIDVRVKNVLTATETKQAYYKPLCRGVIYECAQKFNCIE